jgi:hypothetical protein
VPRENLHLTLLALFAMLSQHDLRFGMTTSAENNRFDSTVPRHGMTTYQRECNNPSRETTTTTASLPTEFYTIAEELKIAVVDI